MSRAAVEAIQLGIYDNTEKGAFGEGPTQEALLRLRCQTAIEVFRQNRFEKEVVVDIGCGNGEVTEALRNSGFLLAFGLDIAQRRIVAIAREKGEPQNPYFVARAQELPFADNSVAGVTCYEVFEHLPKDEAPRMLEEIFRVLKPGGTLILSTINTLSLARRIAKAFPVVPLDGREDHVNEVDCQALKRIMTQHGFDLLQIKGIGIVPGMWRVQKFLPSLLIQDLNIKAGYPFPNMASGTLVIAKKPYLPPGAGQALPSTSARGFP